MTSTHFVFMELKEKNRMSHNTNEETSKDIQFHSHPFHTHLPEHYMDKDGVPFVTKWAQHKARHIVALVQSLDLTQDMLDPDAYASPTGHGDDEGILDDNEEEDGDDNDDEEGDDVIMDDLDKRWLTQPKTMASLAKTCHRIYVQLVALERLKHGGITQREYCDIVLKVLHLICATVRYDILEDSTEDGQRHKKIFPILHLDSVGYIYSSSINTHETTKALSRGLTSESFFGTEPAVEENLNANSSCLDFALPSPARESLLAIAVHILSKKTLLRSVSSAGILLPVMDDRVDGIPLESNDDTLLIIHWKALWRLLIRTAPQLQDDQVSKHPPRDSTTHESRIFQSTIHLIQSCRRFFDQGLNIKENKVTDKSSEEIWSMLQEDLFKTYSNSCFKSSILLYLFHPSRCSDRYYQTVLPLWIQIWRSIDRCPMFDYIWVAMICRARKYVVMPDSFWSPIETRLLSLLQMWLHVPAGGVSKDKSFPQPPRASMRVIPARLAVFLDLEDETTDLFRKVSKLICFCVFVNKTPNADTDITKNLIDLFRYISPYLNPSNSGSWTMPLATFLSCFTHELGRHMGIMAAQKAMGQRFPHLTRALHCAEPYRNVSNWSAEDMASLLNGLLPLCQQGILSKSDYVRTVCMCSLRRLANIDPITVCPPVLDFSIRALDICSLHVTHQTPVALSAIANLFYPLIRIPALLQEHLPDILRLSLAGIDSNDKAKTVRTLILYSNIASWLPIGSWNDSNSNALSIVSGDGSNSIPRGKVCGIFSFEEGLLTNNLSDMSNAIADILTSPENTHKYGSSVELSDVGIMMSDWVLEFLDRLFSLFRATGEREKKGNVGHGVAAFHSKDDAHRTMAFSKVLKEALYQIFASADLQVYESILRSLDNFLDETLPHAAKDVAAMCEALCYIDVHVEERSNSKMALAFLVSKLGKNLTYNSLKSNIYRLRCLSGTVRYSGRYILPHLEVISEAIRFSLSSPDKHLFKCGCKLFRHTLNSLTTAYPMASNNRPVSTMQPSLKDIEVKWSIPSETQIAASLTLVDIHVYESIRKLRTAESSVEFWRRTLKKLKYVMRGMAGILIEDHRMGKLDAINYDPHEIAVRSLLAAFTDGAVREKVLRFRVEILSLCASILDSIAKQSILAGSDDKLENNSLTNVFNDRKVGKEVLAICRILYSYRHTLDEDKMVFDVQKDTLNDSPLTFEAIDLKIALERATAKKDYVIYYDGENGGKILTTSLLSKRLTMFLQMLEINSCFEQPRRLWRICNLQQTRNSLELDSLCDSCDMISLEDGSSTQKPLASSLQYDGKIINCLFSLSCHPNVLIKGASLNVLQRALSRVGWLVDSHRIVRLHNALRLDDANEDGACGLPSFVKLGDLYDQQGRRKQLSEALKGVLLILMLNRPLKIMLSTKEHRYRLAKTMCESWRLSQMLPEEDKAKVVAYFNDIFKKFRSRCFKLPRAKKDDMLHEQLLQYLIEQVRSEVDQRDQPVDSTLDVAVVPWKNRLLFAWFILNIVDVHDIIETPQVFGQLWSLSFDLMECNMAQPLQKVALGIIGRLVSLLESHNDKNSSRSFPLYGGSDLMSEQRCLSLCLALVHNHKEATSKREQQLPDGVDEMIRDANNNLAPITMFPYQRGSQISSQFKLHHVQLVHEIVLFDQDLSNVFLAIAKDFVASPPSEDQRNKHITSSEIFAGVARAMMMLSSSEEACNDCWDSVLLPFLREVIPKIPLSLASSYFDAVVYTVHKLPYTRYEKLSKMIFREVESSLSLSASEALAQQPSVMEGFSLQCKWLQIMLSILNEVNASKPLSDLIRTHALPCLINSLGHPYEVCRGLVAGCLSRICRRSLHADVELVGMIIEQMKSVNTIAGIDQYFHSLLTIRIFLLYCYHREDTKMNYPHIILPLLPVLFETVHGEGSGDGSYGDLTTAQRMIQAETIKTTKLLIADISTSVVCEDHVSIAQTLHVLDNVSRNNCWQVRHCAAHFIRCFHGNHKFIFHNDQKQLILSITGRFLADDRPDVSSAALAALAGILASSSEENVSALVEENVALARKSIMKGSRMKQKVALLSSEDKIPLQQQSGVFFLCAAVLSRPYDTPKFIPIALSEISRHSFEGRATANVRQVVKNVCAEFKRTHMSDNWEIHKKCFNDDQLEALEDVVSAPHYYA